MPKDDVRAKTKCIIGVSYYLLLPYGLRVVGEHIYSRKGYQQRQFSLSGHRGRAIHRDNHIARSPPPDYHIFCFIGFVLFIWACLQLPSLNYPFNLLLLCLPSVTSLFGSLPLFPFRPKNDKIKKVPGDGMPGRR